MLTNERIWNGLRWLARVIGSCTAIFFLFTVLGQNIGKTEPAPTPLLSLLVLASLGVIIAWRWERIGAYILIISSVSLGLFVYPIGSSDPILAALFYSVPFLIPGILFLICSYSHAA
jgi:hypothetical protein